MHVKDVLRQSLDMSDFIMKKYLEGLSDDDLLFQPVEDFNPIALQIGHLIAVDRAMMEGVHPGSCPPLPEGFAERHDLKQGDRSDRSRYRTKDEYVALWDAQRAAAKKLLDEMSDAELDQPGPEQFRDWIPTAGSVFNFMGIHALNHSGQLAAVRRFLGKPIAF